VATDPRWKPVTDGDVMLVHIVAPRAVVEPVAADAVAAAPAAAEPEVIKKGKPEKAEEAK
jgi:hypothetical protein